MGGAAAIYAGRGRIIVTPELASDPPDRLAAVVAHEARHAACSHTLERQAMAAASSASAFATVGCAASRPGLAAELGADAANAGVTLLAAYGDGGVLRGVLDVEAGAGANWLHTVLNFPYPPVAERAGQPREAIRRRMGG